MLEHNGPSSSPNGLMYRLHFLKKTFSLRIILTMMPWSYYVSLKGSWFTMSSLTRVVQQILSLQKPSDRCKSRMTKYMMQHPLCGFGGKHIVALEKITMPITFDYVHNTRMKQVVFDIVDMDYPYNASIGRGTLNAFEAILHPTYLCMKIPSDQTPIAVHGS
jgi:hypothetical protein